MNLSPLGFRTVRAKHHSSIFNLMSMKAPRPPNFESRQMPISHKLQDRSTGDAEVFRHLSNCHHVIKSGWVIAAHATAY
jgi:hypothetical protein